MVKLNEINQTAVFAWSNDPLPLIATGTLAGAMDDTFSSDSSLQIYDAFSNSKSPLVESETDAKFNSVSWSKPFDSFERGLLAGALENGSVQLWDAAKFLDNGDLKAATVAEYKKHSGPVLQAKFNPLQDHIMASSGTKGEIFIWDTKKGTSFNPGQAISPVDKISSLAWNNSMAHIFACAGNTSYTSIWDLKAKREVLQLSYAGANLAVVEWHPSQSTKLVTASNTDASPVILTWDLRNASIPEMVMQGHTKGVLSLDWCKQDPSLLLSSGRDDNTFLWNPLSGDKLCKYPSLPNWVHETKFAPKYPDVFASASFGKKIVIQSLQDTSPPVSTTVQSSNEDDFWNQLSTTDTQQPQFIKKQAPSWLQRPISANFGFGGKLVIVKKDNKTSKIIISKVKETKVTEDTDNSLTSRMEKGDYKSVCETHNDTSKLPESSIADWKLLSNLLEGDNMASLESLLPRVKETEEKEEEEAQNGESAENGDSHDDDFFASLGAEVQKAKASESSKYTPTGEFKLFDGEDEFENNLKENILAGKLDKALDLCISNDKVLEALVLSLNGPDTMKQKAKDAYFSKYAAGSSLARLLYSTSSDNISDVVTNADISSWKDIASAIVAYCENKPSFNTEITKLGDRILESSLEDARGKAIACYVAGSSLDKVSSIWLSELPMIEKYFLESEDSSVTSTSDARIMALEQVIGKVVIYQSTTKADINKEKMDNIAPVYVEYASALTEAGHFELAYDLLEKVPDSYESVKLDKERLAKTLNKTKTSVTNTTSVNGRSNAAPGFSNKSYGNVRASSYVPQKSPVAPMNALASGSLVPGYPYAPTSAASQITMAQPPINPYLLPNQSINSMPPMNTVPPSIIPASTTRASYSAASAVKSNPYAPRTALDSLKQQTQSPQSGLVSLSTTGTPLPPQTKTTSKPSVVKDVGGWNDLPVSMSAKPEKRASQPSIPAAFNFQAAHEQQLQQQAAFTARPPSRTASQPLSMPAPPRSVSRNSVMSSLSPTVNAPQPPRSNKYGPPPGSNAPPEAPTPPNAMETSAQRNSSYANPYAPKPEVNEPVRVPVAYTNISQATASSPLPPAPRNPYAPKQDGPTPTTFVAPVPPQNFSPAYQQTSIPPPPPLAVASSSPPQVVQPPSPAKSEAPEPAKKFPVGDRSNIQPTAIPIYEILTNELEKVKPKIPEKFNKQLTDSTKRINILFEHLNNQDLLTDSTVSGLVKLCESLRDADFDTAHSLQTQIATDHVDECGNWMVGVKRLIGMVEATSH